MKFAILLIVSCLCVSFIDAKATGHILGDVSTNEIGRRRVILRRDTDGPTIHTMTYPDAPSEHSIVGIRLTNCPPKTEVEFFDSKLGDKKLTFVLHFDRGDVDCSLTFYHRA